jgi:hypothetical protein
LKLLFTPKHEHLTLLLPTLPGTNAATKQKAPQHPFCQRILGPCNGGHPCACRRIRHRGKPDLCRADPTQCSHPPSPYSMNMMNGAAYYSPPNRHQKCYASMLGQVEAEKKPDLSEFPSLVEQAVQAGLIQRATVEAVIEQKIKLNLPTWRVINCPECGIRFERGQRHLLKCDRCRIPLRPCSGCGKEFRPDYRKKVCCSKECSKDLQVRHFKANHVSRAKPPRLCLCLVCNKMRPERQSGSAVAKTCSPACATAYRRTVNQLRTKTK